MSAIPHLQRQLRELQQHPVGGFRVDLEGGNLFQWIVWFVGPRGTPYHPGVYKAQLTFPGDFPYKPPEFRILSSFWHPNVYPNGTVCVSILHPPGVDEMNSLESALMRWTPVQSIEKVLVSIISLLSDPDSQDSGAPANVDALVEYRRDRGSYNRRCQEMARQANLALPQGFVPIAEVDEAPKMLIAQTGSSTFIEDDGKDSDDRPYAAEIEQLRAMGIGLSLSMEDLQRIADECNGDLGQMLDRLS